VVALFDVETSRGKLAKGEDGGYTVGQGESIDFISNCKNASKYRWDFGDGATPVTERSPTHTYQSDGDYVVTLTASGVADQSTTAKAMIKVSGSSKIPILIVVVCLAIGGLYGLYLISRRPVLSILVSINGQEGAVRQFSLLGHRVALSELSEPLDCRALKVDGLWKVEFRTREERVIEQLPSHSPIRLEAGAWTQALNPGDFCISGRPSEVIRVQDT